MRYEQQQIAIAKACGRVQRPDGLWFPEGKNYGSQGIPNYLNDLNAMHKAEKMLTPEQLVDYCAFSLRVATGEGCVTDYKMIRATAAQRAEAFLRTIGKWEECK